MRTASLLLVAFLTMAPTLAAAPAFDAERLLVRTDRLADWNLEAVASDRNILLIWRDSGEAARAQLTTLDGSPAGESFVLAHPFVQTAAIYDGSRFAVAVSHNGRVELLRVLNGVEERVTVATLAGAYISPVAIEQKGSVSRVWWGENGRLFARDVASDGTLGPALATSKLSENPLVFPLRAFAMEDHATVVWAEAPECRIICPSYELWSVSNLREINGALEVISTAKGDNFALASLLRDGDLFVVDASSLRLLEVGAGEIAPASNKALPLACGAAAVADFRREILIARHECGGVLKLRSASYDGSMTEETSLADGFDPPGGVQFVAIGLNRLLLIYGHNDESGSGIFMRAVTQSRRRPVR